MQVQSNHRSIFLAGLLLALTACTVRYSFTGGQFSGAKTFSVSYFKPQTALASQVYSLRFTEALKDQLLSQSPLQLIENGGELNYQGSITDYRISPVAAQANETTSLNRLTVSVKVKYSNTKEPDLSFERSFTRFADFDAAKDLFTIEEQLWAEINNQLVQDVYNASVGNW